RARRFGLTTDASQRFERGVDPTRQERAVARAIALLTPIAGGSSGPGGITQSAAALPRRPAVLLRSRQLARLLGVTLPAPQVAAVLDGLEMQVSAVTDGWQVTAPAHRFDMGLE